MPVVAVEAAVQAELGARTVAAAQAAAAVGAVECEDYAWRQPDDEEQLTYEDF